MVMYPKTIHQPLLCHSYKDYVMESVGASENQTIINQL